MLELARIIALLSSLLLVASIIIWASVLRGPLMQRLDGKRLSNSRPTELASKLLVFAFGIGGVAAFLAIAGWISQ
ncbi:hypothetical protein [Sphingomonas limnosediminicola]|jgi:hypothetical protein|uniref:hypothetical protein n=1 Tax=Sphingomonas limnosediminicola TaxID=940133 RepID=UPI0031D452A3